MASQISKDVGIYKYRSIYFFFVVCLLIKHYVRIFLWETTGKKERKRDIAIKTKEERRNEKYSTALLFLIEEKGCKNAASIMERPAKGTTSDLCKPNQLFLFFPFAFLRRLFLGSFFHLKKREKLLETKKKKTAAVLAKYKAVPGLFLTSPLPASWRKKRKKRKPAKRQRKDRCQRRRIQKSKQARQR